MVCRTGLNTVMGSMIRDLLAPTTATLEKDPFVVVGLCAEPSVNAFSCSDYLLAGRPFACKTRLGCLCVDNPL